MIVDEETVTLIEPVPDPGFIVTPGIQDLIDLSLNYLKADLPLHFTGRAGSGKTALAFHVAAKLGRPIVLIHGDEEFKTSDLVGQESGFRIRKLRDQYIHSVLKVNEDVSKTWVDNRLTVACKNGFTLIYDEFTRSRPEANNSLLAVLEEKMLDLPGASEEEGYFRVHPDFRVIFTSNPEEYAGVHSVQDALLDRLVSIKLDHFDKETEIEITRKRADVKREAAEKIVNIVRDFREKGKYKSPPSVRDAVKIAKSIKAFGSQPSKKEAFFRKICLHILASHNYFGQNGDGSIAKSQELIESLIQKHC